eukprot:1032600-Prorocentrum_minimum.AAC.1
MRSSAGAGITPAAAASLAARGLLFENNRQVRPMRRISLRFTGPPIIIRCYTCFTLKHVLLLNITPVPVTARVPAPQRPIGPSPFLTALSSSPLSPTSLPWGPANSTRRDGALIRRPRSVQPRADPAVKNLPCELPRATCTAPIVIVAYHGDRWMTGVRLILIRPFSPLLRRPRRSCRCTTRQ